MTGSEQSAMQFGVFTVGDIAPDPTTGRAPTEHERIKQIFARSRALADAEVSGAR